MKNPPAQSLLRELFHYDPETGIFTRLIARSKKIKVGDVAGSIDVTTGYSLIRVAGRQYKAHHLAWIYVHGTPPHMWIDHINGIRHDNRISNLRLATPQQSNANRGAFAHNRSGTKGVHWNRRLNKWVARIHVNGRDVHIGLFAEKADAIKARQGMAAKHFGEFAKH
jgi:hypothetical protein